MNEYCKRWDGSPVLQLTNAVVENEWINKEIVIKVIASSIETSSMVNPIPQE